MRAKVTPLSDIAVSAENADLPRKPERIGCDAIVLIVTSAKVPWATLDQFVLENQVKPP